MDATKHVLVPKHSRLGEKEKSKILEAYNASTADFPKIHIKDPALEGLKVKEGDIVKIERNSLTAGRSAFYRIVTEKIMLEEETEGEEKAAASAEEAEAE